MAVTKQTYTVPSVGQSWVTADIANAFRSAFIDAGLMTDWYDSFTSGSGVKRVLEVVYDPAKVYGKIYYVFAFQDGNAPSLTIATGWNAITHVPTGTQYLDYKSLPANWSAGSNLNSTILSGALSTATPFKLHRYTSQATPNQSWFIIQQNTLVYSPFTILPGNLSLFSWIDLDKSIVPGIMKLVTSVSAYVGVMDFAQQENVRRTVGIGTALNGFAPTYGDGSYHNISHIHYRYSGSGIGSGNYNNNGGASFTQSFVIPVGSTAANPAYTSNYVPISKGMPWCQYTSTLLADDFAVYAHYANNTMAFEDRFVVTAGVEEWEILAVTNNGTLNLGASPTFLARVV